MQTWLPARQPRYSPPARQVTAAYPGVGAMRTSRQRGIPVARVKGQLVAETLGAECYAQRRPFIGRSLAGETVEFDQAMQWTGRDRQMHTLYLPHQENGVTLGLYALVTDLTAIRRNAAGLIRLARFDALSGLPNRSQFDERLAEAMARTRRLRQPIALSFLDIDRLKTINDSLGPRRGRCGAVGVRAAVGEHRARHRNRSAPRG